MLVALRPQRKADELFADKDMARLEQFLAEGWGNALSHMLFLGDKSFYWAREGRVLFAFARVRDKLVVLGDPLGPVGLVNDAISEFRQAADLYGLAVVFYQATPAYLPVYQSQGYRFFKLGEEALVPLENFKASGPRNADLPSVASRFEREGYVFKIAEPAHSADLLQELRALSEEWLDGRLEKGFSLGWFSKPYLQLAPLALLRGADGQLMAFASVAPGYDGHKTVSIDLMRHRKDTPNGTMDYLFLCLLEWAKSRGSAALIWVMPRSLVPAGIPERCARRRWPAWSLNAAATGTDSPACGGIRRNSGRSGSRGIWPILHRLPSTF